MLAHEVRCEPCISDPTAFHHHYIVVRADLPAGVAAAMVAHAAAGSARGLHDETTHVVVLKADPKQLSDLSMLLALESEEHGLFVYDVVETEGRYAGQLLALGVEPGPREPTRRGYFEHLSLYGR